MCQLVVISSTSSGLKPFAPGIPESCYKNTTTCSSKFQPLDATRKLSSFMTVSKYCGRLKLRVTGGLPKKEVGFVILQNMILSNGQRTEFAADGGFCFSW
jgi:hypothetical protein